MKKLYLFNGNLKKEYSGYIAFLKKNRTTTEMFLKAFKKKR